MKKTNVILSVLLCSMFLLVACGEESYFQSEDSGEKDVIQSEDSLEEDTSPTEASKIFVQVSGAVNSPGVYELNADDRVFLAIEAAGGLREDADDAGLNQAAFLEDGQKIYVYTVDEAKEQEAERVTSDSKEHLLNINTATKEELMTLSGIGESKAESILQYRTEHGGFSSIEDLKNISGIKDGVYQKIADQICVN